MKKIYIMIFVLLFVGCNTAVAHALADTLDLSTNVQTSLAMVVSSNTYNFGDLTANTPAVGTGGIDVDVTTNASNGYTLGIHDGVAGTGSTLLHADTTTRIIDFSALIATPALWVNGVSRGVGVTVYAADTSKEAKWGTGTTYNDALNKYAGVPEGATTIHTSDSYKTGADTTSISFIVDVDPDQKAGVYAGSVTLTSTAVLI